MSAKLLKAIFILIIGAVGTMLLWGIYLGVIKLGPSAVATSGSSAGLGAIMLTIMILGLAYGVFIAIRATFRGVKNTFKEKPDDEVQTASQNG